jgi:hypothetical protein
MAEVLLRFDALIADARGDTYAPRVCGREAEDTLWDGWIEFDPPRGGAALRTPLETRQPNRRDLEYWATGLTVVYLEGALQRALDHRDDASPAAEVPRPAYEGPAHDTPAPRSAAAAPGRRHAVLNPFQVYAQGEDVLRRELSALGETHLENILAAYRIGEPVAGPGPVERLRAIEAIVAAARLGSR